MRRREFLSPYGVLLTRHCTSSEFFSVVFSNRPVNSFITVFFHYSLLFSLLLFCGCRPKYNTYFSEHANIFFPFQPQRQSLLGSPKVGDFLSRSTRRCYSLLKNHGLEFLSGRLTRIPPTFLGRGHLKDLLPLREEYPTMFSRNHEDRGVRDAEIRPRPS